MNKKKIKVIAYLATKGNMENVDDKERKQLRYIKEYADANNLVIVNSYNRSILGQHDCDIHWSHICRQIKAGNAEGVIIAGMKYVSRNLPEAYAKIGKIVEVGGRVFSVDDPDNDMYIKLDMGRD